MTPGQWVQIAIAVVWAIACMVILFVEKREPVEYCFATTIIFGILFVVVSLIAFGPVNNGA